MLDDVLKIGPVLDGRVVELVDTRDLKSLGFGLTGSSPVAPTITLSDVGAFAGRNSLRERRVTNGRGKYHFGLSLQPFFVRIGYLTRTDIRLAQGMTVNGIGIRIRDCRKRAGMSQQDLADRCGVSRAAVAQWESGATHPSTERLLKAGAALNVDTGYLLGSMHSIAPADPSLTLAGRQIPIIDFDQALHLPEAIARMPGTPVLIADAPVGAGCFTLIIKDKSMAPDFLPGDRIIVDPDVKPHPGDFVVAHVKGDDEAVLRKFRSRGTSEEGIEECELAPLNPDWPTAQIDWGSPGKIIGTVVERRRYRDGGQ